MPSPYDPSLTLNRDKVRFIVGDTDDTDYMLQDGEIEFMLAENTDNVYLAAAQACRAIAARFARDVNYRFSTLWQDSSDAYDHYMALADKLEAQSAGSDIGTPVFTAGGAFSTDAPEIFWYGMHDNPPVTQDEEDA